jgi:osmoprotectant transport system ATP-binding protein
LIRLKNIHKSFGKQAVLKGIDLTIEAGSTQVLLGLSGSGKTTTLRLINGLEQPNQGRVEVDGKALNQHDMITLRKTMGYVVQSGGLFPHYTVAQNIALVLQLLGWSKETIQERTRTLCKKLQLPEELLHRLPDTLSGGQQQRVGLARALAAQPKILLMDEPFGALDPITRVAIRKEFLELDELKNTTVVLVTHDVQEAFLLGDCIALMQEGKVIQNGKPSELLYKPNSNFVRDFVAHEAVLLDLKMSGKYKALEEEYKSSLS